MKYTLDFESLLIICFIMIIVYCIFRHFKHMESFVDKTDKEILDDTINKEMDKQLLLLKAIDNTVPETIDNYIPHYDIRNRYKNNLNKILNAQKNTINTHTEQKQEELEKLDNTIKSLQDYAQIDFLKKENTKNIGIIKSHNNGTELSVELTNDINDNPFNRRNYLVKMNGGCLKVESNNNYNTIPCNKEDKDQLFNLEHVYNTTGYKNKLDPAFSRLTNIQNVYYPFSLVKSNSNGNCLKQIHGKISVEPCREYEGQRWASLKNTKQC